MFCMMNDYFVVIVVLQICHFSRKLAGNPELDFKIYCCRSACQSERLICRDVALLPDDSKQPEKQRLRQRKKNAVLPTLTTRKRHAVQSISLLVVRGVVDRKL